MLEVIGYILLSTVKFAVASFPISLTYSYQEALLILISGGIIGVLFFLFLWEKLLHIWTIYIYKSSNNSPKPFKISNKKRRIIKVKNQYGYWGIVIFTPVFLSIPLGVFLLLQYFQRKKYKALHLSLSIVFWSFVYISFFKFIA